MSQKLQYQVYEKKIKKMKKDIESLKQYNQWIIVEKAKLRIVEK